MGSIHIRVIIYYLTPPILNAMYLKLAHSKLDVYQCVRQLVLGCYKLSKHLPDSERYILVQQIRRAGISVQLNIAEGCTRRSRAERKRYFEIARGSVVEVDTAFEIVHDLKYLTKMEMDPVGNLIIRSYQMLSAMINAE